MDEECHCDRCEGIVPEGEGSMNKLTRICAWCKPKHIIELGNPDRLLSHGMCDKARDVLLEKIDRGEYA